MTEKRWLYFGIVLAVTALAAPASAGDGLVALQTADPACPDNSGNIYVDCGNGTVTDNRTGLVWLANTNCVNGPSWYEAMEIAAGLADLPDGACGGGVTRDNCDCGLRDGSSPGEWRLASMAELKAMVKKGKTLAS